MTLAEGDHEDTDQVDLPLTEASDTYVSGDVNTTVADADSALDDLAGNRVEGGTPNAVLTYVARALTEEPDAVVVETESRQGSVRLRLHVAPNDMGRVIGRRGRTAQAIRALVVAAGAKDGIRTSVDIAD